MKFTKLTVLFCTGVLAAGCVTKQTYNKEVSVADTYQALNTKLTSELGADQAQITQLQNQLKVTLVNEILFPEGADTS